MKSSRSRGWRSRYEGSGRRERGVKSGRSRGWGSRYEGSGELGDELEN